jgi:hypothetical protein
MPPKSKAKLKSNEQIAAEEAATLQAYRATFGNRAGGSLRHLLKEFAKTAPKPTTSGGLKESGGQKVSLQKFEAYKRSATPPRHCGP